MNSVLEIAALPDAEREALRKALATPQQTFLLALMKTQDDVQYRSGQLFKRYGLSHPQYNILRILRGEGKPLPSLEISNRLITRVPAITSLVDKLEARGLVLRKRCDRDRRVWYVALTQAGLDLLAEMDGPVQALSKDLCARLTNDDCQELARLLGKVRGEAAE